MLPLTHTPSQKHPALLCLHALSVDRPHRSSPPTEPRKVFLFGRNRLASRPRSTRSRGQRIDHLARTSVVQLFASLMFNCVGIALQPVNMPLQLVVFFLQTPQLMVETLGILPLLLIGGKPILPKDNVVPHRQRKQRRRSRRNLAPALMTSLIQTHDRALSLYLRALFARTSHLTQYKLHVPHRQVEIPVSLDDVPDSYRLTPLSSIPLLILAQSAPNRLLQANKLHEDHPPCYPY
jgi:hypothetical protein